jgi:hypothetical protein
MNKHYLNKLKELKNVIEFEDSETAMEFLDELIDEIEMDDLMRKGDMFDEE